MDDAAQPQAEGLHHESTGNVAQEQSSPIGAASKTVKKPTTPLTRANLELQQQQRDALAVALAKINKQYGKGTVSQLGSQPAHDTSRVISTGSLAIDDAIGAGGVPQGRIVEIFGPEASGKTCRFVAQCTLGCED